MIGYYCFLCAFPINVLNTGVERLVHIFEVPWFAVLSIKEGALQNY